MTKFQVKDFEEEISYSYQHKNWVRVEHAVAIANKILQRWLDEGKLVKADKTKDYNEKS